MPAQRRIIEVIAEQVSLAEARTPSYRADLVRALMDVIAVQESETVQRRRRERVRTIVETLGIKVRAESVS